MKVSFFTMAEFHLIQVFTVSRCEKVGFLQHVSQSVIFDDFVVLHRFLLQLGGR